MGRTSGNNSKTSAKNPVEKKEERNRRMRKFGLTIVRPSKVEKDIRRELPKDRHLGRGSAEMLAVTLEYFLKKLFKRLKEEAGEKHQVNAYHFAKTLADPKSGFHGIFPTRVAGVHLPVERTERKTKKVVE
jgi:hypothetical protein